MARPTGQKTSAIEKRTVTLGDDRREGQTLEGRGATWGSRGRGRGRNQEAGSGGTWTRALLWFMQEDRGEAG